MNSLFIYLQKTNELNDEAATILGIGLTAFFIIGGVFYFLPSLIALMRGKSNSIAILALNLFLGWTLIGWVVSLVWSLSSDAKPQKIIINQDKVPQEDNFEKLKKLKNLLDSGTINQKEFDIQKKRLLK
jgi:uncharacterized membrane protein